MTRRHLLIAAFNLLAFLGVHNTATFAQGDPANTTCWKSDTNPDGTGGNKQCEVKEVPGETTGTAHFTHTETSQGGNTTVVDDGTNTYDRASGNTTNGDGQVTDHMQFSADGQSMTHTHTEYDENGHVKSMTVQTYHKVPCKKLKKKRSSGAGSA